MSGGRRNPPGVTLHRLAFSPGSIALQEMGLAVCGVKRSDGDVYFAPKSSKVTCVACKEKIEAARARAAEARR